MSLNQPTKQETVPSATYQAIHKFLTDNNRGLPTLRKRITISGKHTGLTIQYQTTGMDGHGSFRVMLPNGQEWNITRERIENLSTVQAGTTDTYSLKQVLESLEIKPPEGLPEEVQQPQRNFRSMIKGLLGL